LLSHDVKHVLEDIGTVRGTKNDEFWRAIKLGQTPPTPKVPFIFNKFIASLQSAGVNVNREGNVFNILPMTDKDTLKLSAGPINKPTMFKPYKNELVHEPGGLFDPIKVGVMGDKFNHIDLNVPVPNPISEDYLRKLLGVTKVGYNELITSGGITKKMEGVNLDGKIVEIKKYIISGKRTDRDKNVKLLEFLITLKNNKIEVKDLMLHKVPILPAQFRPASKMGDVVLTSDVNNLYKDLILTNNELKHTEGIPEDVVTSLKQNQYNAVKAVFGLGEPVNKKHKDKNIKGLLATMLGLKGGTAKSTMFQARVVNKSLDSVGRAVLVPDARLDVDQASLPQDLLWQVYKPFVIRRLVMRGVPAMAAVDYVKKHNSLAVQALKEEMAVRPGIVTRDPAWHKFNMMGFNLIPNTSSKDKTLKLNPLVFKGFGADSIVDYIIYREKLN
jgi:DNA-directed RNA polymerase beta' subunit